MLRLAHPAAAVSAGNPTLDVTPEQARLFEWIVRGGDVDGLPRIVEGFVRAQAAATAAELAELVREYELPREAVLPQHLTDPLVWEALLERMPMTAMIRNLAHDDPRRAARRRARTPRTLVIDRLSDGERLAQGAHPPDRRADRRCAPTPSGTGCAAGRPGRRSPGIVDALDDAFYLAFGNVAPTGKRLLLALDVSGSMGGADRRRARPLAARGLGGDGAGHPGDRAEHRGGRLPRRRGGWTARQAGRFGRAGRPDPAAAVGRASGWTTWSHASSGLPFGGTDCALPMLYALEQRPIRSTRS